MKTNATTSQAPKDLRFSWISLFAGTAIVTAFALVSGCSSSSEPIKAGNSKFQVADGKGTATPPADANNNGIAVDPAPVPPPKPITPPKRTKAADPAEPAIDPAASPADRLAALLSQIERQRPQGTTPQEMQESFGKILNQRIQVAQELLNTSTQEAQQVRAVEAITETLMTMQQMGNEQAGPALADFAAKLVGHKSAPVAMRGRQMVLQFCVEDLIEDKGKSLPQFLTQVDELLALSKDETNFDLMQKICMVLNQSGMNKESKEVLGRLVTAFEKHENPEIVEAVGIVREMQVMNDAGMSNALSNFMSKQPGASDSLLGALKQVLASELVGKGTLSQLRQILTLLEGEDVKLASSVGKDIETTFAAHKDPAVAKEAGQFIENSRKRTGLVGQEFVVAGSTINGEKFDWAPYQGKVVLVDFWATWCGPCLAEVPNIRKAYEEYHDKGFEVVGVNLDDEPMSVVKFLTLQPLPWTTVVSADAANSGFKNPIAVTCGVEMIPFVMLIGKDGKVDSIHVRGKRLEERLATIFGGGTPPAEPKLRNELKPEGTQTPSNSNDDVPVNSLRQKSGVRKASAEEEVPAAPATGCAADEESKDDAAAEKAEEKPVNPYAAKPTLTTEQLVDYLLRMEDKPKVIQLREGFSAAVIDACDRILAANPSESQALLALESKGTMLHRWAGRGDAQAEKAWRAFTTELRSDTRPRIARMVNLFTKEQLAADAVTSSAAEIAEVLKDTKAYLSGEKLDGRHLRLASNTVALINRIDDGDQRETEFKAFGELFAKSRDKELSRYGKKLVQSPEGSDSDLVGKTMELVGATLKGEAFDVQSLRGKVVVVDFWATWCGPCRKELPRLEAAFEKLHPQGLEVVGVSLDADLDALTAFLEEHPLPWKTLAGEGNQSVAEKYGVRGIPTLIVVDQAGKIAAVAHSIEQLKPQVEKLLSRG